MDSICRKRLAEFFNYDYEHKLEEKILNGIFFTVKEKTFDYVKKIIDIPMHAFVEYISENCKRQPIIAADVFQFSNFDDATIHICSQIQAVNNPGIKLKKVAQLLFSDNIQRNDGALTKYGENHIKTAESLGLAFRDSTKKYYLSAIGCIFSELEEKDRTKLLVRLIIRNKLITQLFIEALNSQFDLEAFLYDLSPSTYIRRRTNINKVIQIINNSNEYDFSSITKNIIY